MDANVSAIRLAKQLEAEKRHATAAEKAVLSRFNGWGAFKEVFNEQKAARRHAWPDWEKAYGKYYDGLKGLLTEQEFREAAAASLFSHYTSPEVIQQMWKLVERLGFKGGRVLEPSAGKGDFIGWQPAGMAGRTRWTAVELDPVTGLILSKLYAGSDVRVEGFEKARIPNNSQDLVLTNVPFNKTGPGAEYPTLNLHNYFIARALDKAKPGGLVVVISSNSTLDNNRGQRELLAGKGQLVGAIRLPNTAFKGNAGTEVVTDIIVLRKPDATPFTGEPFEAVRAVPGLEGVEVNEYFLKHPEMVLGKHSTEGGMYRENSYTVKPSGKLEEQLPAAIARMPKDILREPAKVVEEYAAAGEKAEKGQKEFSYQVGRDGQVYQVREGAMVRADWAGDRDAGRKIEVARRWVKLRDALMELVNAETSVGTDEGKVEELRRKLNAAYDGYVEAPLGKGGTIGALNRRMAPARFMDDDPEYAAVLALEDVEEMPDPSRPGKVLETFKKAPIFRARQSVPTQPPASAASVGDALGLSMAWRGKPDVDYMAGLVGRSKEAVESELLAAGTVFKNPTTGLLETPSMYLTGNVRVKLYDALAAAKDDPAGYKRNVEELKKVQPERIGFDQIRMPFGARWVAPEIYSRFLARLLDVPVTVSYLAKANKLVLDYNRFHHSAKNTVDFAGGGMAGMAIADVAINLGEPTVYAEDPDGKRVVDQPKTAAARAVAKRIRDEFEVFVRTAQESFEHRVFDEGAAEWVTKPSPLAKVLEDQFNDAFNGHVVPTYDGSFLTLPGLSASVRRTPHMLAGVLRAIQDGSVVFAHGVGTGKTFLQIVTAMELKRLGLANKPMLVVKPATVEQFAAAFRRAYPGAKLLVPTPKDFSADRRQKLLARVATGNWDAVILTHDQFTLTRNDPQAVADYLNAQIEELRQVLAAERARSGKGAGAVRDIENAIRALEKKRDKILGKLDKRQDNALYWEQLGVDALFVDEAHNFKKLPLVTRMQRVKGIPNDSSQRAVNLLIKLRDVQDRTGGRNVFLATGTPVSNTMAELWVMLHMASPHILKQYGVENFDEFATAFGTTVEEFNINAFGKFKRTTRFSKFINGPSLVKMVRQVMDVRMGSREMGLDVPDVVGGGPKPVIVKQWPAYRQAADFIGQIEGAYNALQGKAKREYSWVVINAMQYGIAAALDPRLVLPGVADDPNSKVNQMVRNVIEEYHAGAGRKATQLVFADRFRSMNSEKLQAFVGGREIKMDLADEEVEDAADEEAEVEAPARFNIYHDIKAKLVAAGIPAGEIVIANEVKEGDARFKMQEDFRAGTIRVLLGSTEKMGEGVNLQDRLFVVHHMDPPGQMTPAKMEQRNGRIIRQGNMHAPKQLGMPVKIYNYATEMSMDTALYGMLESKQRFIEQTLSGNATGVEWDDPAGEVLLSFAEMKALSTGDTRVLRMAQLQAKVRDLQVERAGFLSGLSEARNQLQSNQSVVRYNQGKQAVLRKQMEAAAVFGSPDEWKMVVGGKEVVGQSTIVAALEKVLQKVGAKVVAAEKDGKPINESIRANINGWPGVIEITALTGIDAEGKQETKPLWEWYLFAEEADAAAGQTGVAVYDTNRLRTVAGIVGSLEKVPKELADRLANSELSKKRAQELIPKLESKLGGKWDKDAELKSAEAELTALEKELEGVKEEMKPTGDVAAAGEDESDGPVETRGAGGGTMRSKGLYRTGVASESGGVPVVLGGMAYVRPVEMPELVKLARGLSGKVPALKKFPRAMGHFDPAAKLIRLDPRIFSDSTAAAKTLAHEVGHLIDWLPDEVLTRGNIKGRLHSLRSFLKERFGASTVTNKEIRKELLAVTMFWKPYDPTVDPESYVKYRESSVELYADALSVLFNSPGLLERMAPKFYKEFWEALNTKPEVLRSLLGLQDFLNKGKVGVLEERQADIRGMFQKGEAIFKQKADEREARRKSWDGTWTQIKQQLVDKMAPVVDRQKMAEARGRTWKMGADPASIFEMSAMVENTNAVLVRRFHDQVVLPIEEMGMTLDDLGELMFLERVVAGDRTTFANPLGQTPETARLQLLNLRLDLGMNRMQRLADARDKFTELRWEAVLEGVRLGVYSREVFRTIIRPNKDTYAAFGVLDYLEDYVPAGIREQMGTLKEVANPATVTLLKTLALQNLNAIQEAKMETRDLLLAEFPGEIERVEVEPGHTPPRKQGFGVLKMLEDGKAVHYYVDPYIAEAFEKWHPAVAKGAAKILTTGFRQFIYPLMITYNPGFMLWLSPMRDFKRTARNLPIVAGARTRLAINYLKVWRDAVQRLRGVSTPLVREMEDNFAIGMPWDSFAQQHRSDFLARLMVKYKLVPQDEPKGFLHSLAFKPARAVLDWIEFYGTALDSLPKLAAFKLLRARGQTPAAAAAFVRNYAGLPNTKTAGTKVTTVRAAVPFFNVFAQGLRRDVEMASQPSSRSGWWFKWASTSGMFTLMKVAAALGLLGEALKRMMDGVSEYDKTNYNVVPLGLTSGGDFGGKTVTLRVPMDEMDRFASAALYKALMATGGEARSFNEVFSIGSGVVPSWNPMLTIPKAWAEFASGQNPQDTHRNRPIVGRDEWKAGGVSAWSDMFAWTLGQSGALNFFKYDPNANSTEELVVSGAPVINRILKVSDYGMREQQMRLEAKDQSLAAAGRLALPAEVKAIYHEYWSLERIKAERRTPQQAARFEALNAWYQQDFRPMDEDVKLAEEAGRKDQAASIREMMRRTATGLLRK